MSGPIRPPLRVEEEDGSPSVRPVNTIKVTDGTLTDDGGATVTIDTSGGGTAAPADAEYLLAFDASIPAALTAARKLTIGANISFAHGAGANDDVEIFAKASKDGTGASPDGQIQYCGPTSNLFDAISEFYYDQPNGALYAGTNVTNGDASITILADGTGEPTLNLSNPSAAVSLTCDTNQQLKLEGGLNTFIFDASSATGGIQWPDGTIQTTAASGGGVDGSGTANTIPKWSDSDTLTDSRLTEPNSYETLVSGAGGVTFIIQATDGNEPNFKLLNSSSAGWYLQQSGDADSIYWKRVGSGVKRLELASDGELTVNEAYKLPTAVTGANDYVLTAQTDGSTAWAAAGGGGVTFPLEADDAGGAAAPSYSFDGDTNTGMFRLTGDVLGFSVGGSAAMYMQSSKVEANKDFEFIAGSAASPSAMFASDNDTGLYSKSANHIGFATGGVANVSMGQDGGITEMIIYGQSGNSSQITTDAGTDLFLSTARGTDSGKIQINAGAGGDIEILPSGSGAVEINGAYKLPTAVTGTNDYVLTAQTDGSTAWAAAGGGGGGSDNIDFAGVRTTFASNSRYNVGMQSPWVTGSNSVATTGFAYVDDGFLWPFLYPLDGAITEFGVTMGTTGGSGGVKLAVYASDSDGIPTTMLARADIADGGSGSTYTTTITGPSSGAASSATAGDLCWMASTRYDGATNTAVAMGPSGNTGIIGPSVDPNGTTPNCYRFTAYDASTTWPDTISTATANAENNMRMRVTIKVA